MKQRHNEISESVRDQLDALLNKYLSVCNAKNCSEAELLAKEALQLVEHHLTRHHEYFITVLHSLGNLYYDRGRFGEALPLLVEALALSEEVCGKHHSWTASLRKKLGLLYRLCGQYSDADRILDQALQLEGRAQTPDTLHQLANLRDAQHRFGEAESYYKKALHLSERALGRQAILTLTCCNDLALLYCQQGRYEEAEPLFERVLRNRQNVSSELFDASTSNLALWHERQGQHGQAEALLKNALQYSKEAGCGLHPRTLVTLNNLATLYSRQGRFNEAESLFVEVLRRRGEVLGEDHPDTISSLIGLAAMYSRLNRFDDALSLYKRALITSEKVFGNRHPVTATVLGNLGTLYCRNRQYPDALHHIRQSTNIRKEHGIDMLPLETRGSRFEQRTWRDYYVNHLAILNCAAAANVVGDSEACAEGFEVAQLAAVSDTARATTRMAARLATGDDEMAAIIRDRQKALDCWEAEDALLIRELSKSRDQRDEELIANLQARIAETELKISSKDTTIAERFPKYAELTNPRPLEIKQTQSLLNDGEALAFYIVAENESYVFLLRPGDAHLIRLNVGGEALAEAVSDLRAGLDPPHGTRDLSPIENRRSRLIEFDVDKAHKLYKEVWAPIEPLLDGARNVFVVTDGPLQNLPMHVLVTEVPSAEVESTEHLREIRWLVKKDYAISVLPSVSTLWALRTLASKKKPGDGFIGFADPLLRGNHTPDVKAVSLDWRGPIAEVASLPALCPLPESADEMMQLAKSVAAPRTAWFLGREATERQVRDLNRSKSLAKAGLLVFATHGVMAGEISGLNEPGLVLTPPENPTEEDDGFLTASEVTNLELNAEWVILSACNTGATDGTPKAEGLSGLARAFFYAGTRSLLVSHWSIYSQAAVMITTGTLTRLRETPQNCKAEALRRTMVDLVENGPDPRPAYWAPFVVVGGA